ncbi:hypothetical protein [Sphingomonas flavalba]|nr:hypothetical protein [Sphingomonas flavalba]
MTAFFRSDLFRHFAAGFALVAIAVIGLAPDSEADSAAAAAVAVEQPAR